LPLKYILGYERREQASLALLSGATRTFAMHAKVTFFRTDKGVRAFASARLLSGLLLLSRP
jgi:hypothetical protein